ncbi:MAG: GntR family transcriptional regulator [Beijerinckiaceae bacterium]|jgi:DNA-binding GntR family transcriptional regulator
MNFQSNPRDQAGLTFEAIAEMMAHDLQSGLFAPGQWLKQIDLEARYGAKRIEVRRALDRLVQRRLVQHLPNRGYHVYALDDQRAADIRDVRAILETAAVDGIVERATRHDIKKAQRLAMQFHELIDNGTLVELYDANLAFHRHLLELCPNKELVSIVNDLRSRLSSAPASQWQKRSRIDQSNLEHFEMVDALAAGERQRLKAIISAHIRQVPRPHSRLRRPVPGGD